MARRITVFISATLSVLFYYFMYVGFFRSEMATDLALAQVDDADAAASLRVWQYHDANVEILIVSIMVAILFVCFWKPFRLWIKKGQA